MAPQLVDWFFFIGGSLLLIRIFLKHPFKIKFEWN